MKIKIKTDLNECDVIYTLYFDDEVEMVSRELREIMECVTEYFISKEANGGLLHAKMNCTFAQV